MLTSSVLRLLVLAVFAAVSTRAQTPRLVRDINQIAATNPSSAPAEFARVGSQTCFTATTATTGREPYVTNGLSGTTRLLRDIEPGTNYSFPAEYTAVAGLVFFVATDRQVGREVWVTDLTGPGTRPLDIRTGVASSNPSGLFAFGNEVFFAADDGVVGREVWSTDGTSTMTALVEDVNHPPAGSTASAKPQGLVCLGERLLFSVDGNVPHREIWASDGTWRSSRLASCGRVMELRTARSNLQRSQGPTAYHVESAPGLHGSRHRSPAAVPSCGGPTAVSPARFRSRSSRR